MNQSIEKTALSNLITNEDYARKVIPFLKGDYFKVREERIVFEEIQKFIDKYKKIPTKTTLNIEIENRKDLKHALHPLSAVPYRPGGSLFARNPPLPEEMSIQLDFTREK